jgi:hypothetical protein
MALDDKVSKSFDFAQDVVKQLITLATAVLTITVTFLDKVLAPAPKGAKIMLGAGWLVYLVSILFGVFTLMTLSGKLATTDPPSIYDGGIRIMSGIQILLFVVATGLTIGFGIWALL